MSVWFGYAAVDILLKYTSSLGLQFTLTLNLIFITAFVLSIIYLIFQKIQHGILKYFCWANARCTKFFKHCPIR